MPGSVGARGTFYVTQSHRPGGIPGHYEGISIKMSGIIDMAIA